jgi:hypothetical protein
MNCKNEKFAVLTANFCKQRLPVLIKNAATTAFFYNIQIEKIPPFNGKFFKKHISGKSASQ